VTCTIGIRPADYGDLVPRVAHPASFQKQRTNWPRHRLVLLSQIPLVPRVDAFAESSPETARDLTAGTQPGVVAETLQPHVLRSAR
jgi:hypothetical protein